MPSGPYYEGHILLVNTFSLEVAQDLSKYIKKKQLLSCAMNHNSELSPRVSFFVQGNYSQLGSLVKYGRFNFNTKYLKLFSTKRVSCLKLTSKME